MISDEVGPNKNFRLTLPIDYIFLGTIARVFDGFLKNSPTPNAPLQQAIKIQRPEKLNNLDTIVTEVQILQKLQGREYAIPLYEMGFLQFSDGQSLPKDWLEKSAPPREYWASNLTGQAERYGLEEADRFLANLELRALKGWLPYLALGRCGYEGTNPVEPFLFQVFPTEKPIENQDDVALLVEIAIQICQAIHEMHTVQVEYREYKKAHFCWHRRMHKLTMIDWNLSVLCDQPLSQAQRRDEISAFGAKVLGVIITGDDSYHRIGRAIPWEKVPASAGVPDRLMQVVNNMIDGQYNSIEDVETHLRGILKVIHTQKINNSMGGFQ